METIQQYHERKIVEQALFVLERSGGLDRFHLFKVLYFAERAHLAKWGTPMSAERYHALEYGPVPSRLYSAVREQNNPTSFMGKIFWEAVEAVSDEAKGIMVAKREPDWEYLSEAATEALAEATDEYANIAFGALSKLSHGVDWQRGRLKGGTRSISKADMAESEGASPELVEWVEDLNYVIGAVREAPTIDKGQLRLLGLIK